MGFLFDSLKNLAGDLECASLAFSQGVSERSCDRYTGAKGVNTTATEESKKLDFNSAAKHCKEMLTYVIDSDKKNNKAGDQASDELAKRLYCAAMEVLPKYIDIESSIIIANTMATMLLAEKDITTITANNIFGYCSAPNVKYSAEYQIAAMTAFTNNIIPIKDKVFSEIEAIMKVAGDTTVEKSSQKTEKPFTLDFSGLNNGNAGAVTA